MDSNFYKKRKLNYHNNEADDEANIYPDKRENMCADEGASNA